MDEDLGFPSLTLQLELLSKGRRPQRQGSKEEDYWSEALDLGAGHRPDVQRRNRVTCGERSVQWPRLLFGVLLRLTGIVSARHLPISSGLSDTQSG